MFSNLAALKIDESIVRALGRSGSSMDLPAGALASCTPSSTSPNPSSGETRRPEEHSLAYRDLERGLDCDLPSGVAIARVIGLDPLSKEALGLQALGWEGETPLWYYVLKEAETQDAGERLGEVGGRIVAQVLLGLLEGDPHSYKNVNPHWRPTLPGTRDGEFTMADVLILAGVT